MNTVGVGNIQRRAWWLGFGIVAACLLGTAALPAKGGENEKAIVVVTNPLNPADEVSLHNLQRMFLKQKTLWTDGLKCVPIDQSSAKQIRKRFSKLALGKDVEEMKRYWMQQTMTGNARPPIVLDGAALVKRYIQRIPGGIAYIYADEVDESVKVLRVAELPELSPSTKKSETESDATEKSPPPQLPEEP